MTEYKTPDFRPFWKKWIDDDDDEIEFLEALAKASGRLKEISDRANADYEAGKSLPFP